LGNTAHYGITHYALYKFTTYLLTDEMGFGLIYEYSENKPIFFVIYTVKGRKVEHLLGYSAPK